jgi:putative oxidoreductase
VLQLLPLQLIQGETSMSTATTIPDPTALSAALLLLRLIFGGMFLAHATQKLFGWLGGGGFEATVEGFARLGFWPARLQAALAAGTELVAGALILLGLLGPVGPALLVSVMLVAAVAVHPHGLMASQNGIEMPLLYAGAATSLALIGYGNFSLDRVLGIAGMFTPAIALGMIAVFSMGAIISLVGRRQTA